MDAIRRAITKAILGGKPGGAWEGGIRAYHSSPHDFDKVDFSKLRTGEGANVYGAGHYMAENPAVSGQGGQYWSNFLHRFEGGERFAADRLHALKYDRDAALKGAADDLAYWKDTLKSLEPHSNERAYVERMLANRQKEHDLIASGQPVGPRTYEMNLRAKPEELLDWDKPVSREWLDPSIRGWFETAKQSYGGTQGKHLYEAMQDFHSPVVASKALADAGIPGIRYLDEGSRTSMADFQRAAAQFGPMEQRALTGDERARDAFEAVKRVVEKGPQVTYNYVGVDPSKLDILAKYGVAGAVAGPTLGAFTRQDNYEEAR